MCIYIYNMCIYTYMLYDDYIIYGYHYYYDDQTGDCAWRVRLNRNILHATCVLTTALQRP